MSAEKAKAYYLNKGGMGKLNCCQAVAAAFKDKCAIDDATLKSFAAYGSGNAPGGVCGAYYAANFILGKNNPEKAAQCKDFFISKAGSDKCKEIRKLKKLSCIGCVETMAGFVENPDKMNTPCGSDKCATPSGGRRTLSLEGQVRLIAGIMVISGIALAWLVHWAFIFIAVFVGCGLIYAGLTDNCLMSIVLAKLPHNKGE